ncbi:MAG: hypothetical protein HY401_00630 [Elusimicrobia bacterium]|nr:hypothetical protein [Elusimicrobiota bacterium]
MRILIAAVLLWNAPVGAWAISAPEETELNSFLSNLTSGGYAQAAVAGMAEQFLPFVNLLPIDFLAADEQVARLLQKETARHARHTFGREMGRMGLSGPLSLNASGPSPTANSGRSFKRQKPLSWRAKLSTRQVGLALLWRF